MDAYRGIYHLPGVGGAGSVWKRRMDGHTEQPEALRRGFAGSLLTLAARENGTLVGLLRAVGDGCTVVLVQDLLVRPDHQRRGIGTALMQAALERFRSVRQVQLLTDDTEKTKGFYRSLGLDTAGAGVLRLHAPVKPHGGECPGHSPPCFVLCTGRSAPVLVLLLLLVLDSGFGSACSASADSGSADSGSADFLPDIEAPPSVSAIQLQFARKPAEHPPPPKKLPGEKKNPWGGGEEGGILL